MNSPPGEYDLVELLDKLIGEGGDLGEKKSKRRRTPWFSRPLVKARQTVSLLRHYVNGLKTNVDRSRVIQQRLQQIDQMMELPTTTKEAAMCLREHEENLRVILHQDEDLRRAELTENAQKADDERNGKKASANRKISRSEQNLRTWRCLHFMSAQGQTSQLNRIDVPESWHEINEDEEVLLEDPKTATRWKTITNPTSIEYFLMRRNYQHFGQARFHLWPRTLTGRRRPTDQMRLYLELFRTQNM
jgi:hypothetical protein